MFYENKITLIDNYNEIIEKSISQLRFHVSNNRIRDELLKMLKNEFKMNSFLDLKDNTKSNDLIVTIKKWWIEDKYELGLKKCMNIIDELIKNE